MPKAIIHTSTPGAKGDNDEAMAAATAQVAALTTIRKPSEDDNDIEMGPKVDESKAEAGPAHEG